jgi:hypothetical protein
MPDSMLSESVTSEGVSGDRPVSPLEVHRFHCLRTLFMVGYVVVVLAVLAELRYYPHTSDLGRLAYLFGMLVGPVAFFLLLLHVYEFRGLVKTGEHAIPLTVDVTYFMYVVVTGVSFVLFFRAFQVWGVSAQVFSATWYAALVVLCGELLGCLVMAKLVVRRWVRPHLPSFFGTTQEHHRFHRSHVRARFVLRKNIPNWTIWEQDDCYTRIKRV